MNFLKAGVDEVHYGAVFGPVYAAAVIIPDSVYASLARSGVKDSKAIRPKERERLGWLIRESCAYGIGSCTAAEMRQLGWLRATHEAMRRALSKLRHEPDLVQVDGLKIIPQYPAEKQKAIVGGDRMILEISAASIIAKVAADTAVIAMAEKYPMYDLHRNKGYLSSAHQRGINEYGLCPEHRKFRSCKA